MGGGGQEGALGVLGSSRGDSGATIQRWLLPPLLSVIPGVFLGPYQRGTLGGGRGLSSAPSALS